MAAAAPVSRRRADTPAVQCRKMPTPFRGRKTFPSPV
uniref:Uncharacterized protein n=1 Tax=Tetraselmis sp. GSL018 TaxID=582737 RepID=A0A061RNL0_9CHLO